MAEQLLRDSVSTPIVRDEYDYDHALFAHPGYDQLALLLRLPPYRTPLGYGVHHQTALDACCIIANNLSGFLFRTSDRSGRVPTEDVILTTPATYWYFLGDESLPAQYEVVDDFRAWKFATTLPDHWHALRPRHATIENGVSDSAMSATVITADKCCIASGYREHHFPSDAALVSWYEGGRWVLTARRCPSGAPRTCQVV